MKTEIERRLVPAHSAHTLRAIGDGSSMRIGGYAAMFNSYSHDLGGFKERIKPGAFKRCLMRGESVVCLFNHDPNMVLGRTTAGTLTMKEDAKGLYFECNLPDTSAGRDTHKSVQRGDVAGCSFAFSLGTGDDAWDEDQDESGRFVSRTISNFAGLFDVGPVTYPAYPDTSVGTRALAAIPANTPVEVRSRIIAVRAQLAEQDDSQARRRALLNSIL